MKKWSEIAQEFYDSKDFNKLVSYYEEQLESNPDDVEGYWYLALAHTLNNSPTEVDSLRFYLSAMGLEPTPEAIAMFTHEKDEQIKEGNFFLARLLAEEIVKFNPNNFSVVLALVDIELKLGIFVPSKLVSALALATRVDYEALSPVLVKMLWKPQMGNIELLEASWVHCDDIANTVSLVGDVARGLGGEASNIRYTSQLIISCLKQSPENTTLLKILTDLYIRSGHLKEARKAAEEFYKWASSPTMKLAAHYHIIYTYLMGGNWSNLSPVIKKHKKLIGEVIASGIKEAEPLVSESMLFTAQPLLYFQDTPKENQYLRQKMGQIFTKSLNIPQKCFLALPTREKLRIGYIGHTMRRHSVGWLCRWLIKYHDRENFDIFLYLVNQKPDELTKEWFSEKDNTLRVFENIQSNPPSSIAAQIQADGIDILVDLDSLTGSVTSSVMCFKPAPIQVTWLGFDSSGLECIDYFIADPYCLPKDAQDYYREKIWRLPYTYLAVDGFEIGVPSLHREDLGIPDDGIVYLNVQGPLKRNPESIRLQLKIIKQVPNSYLLIKGVDRDKEVKDFILELAKREKVESNRIRFLARDVDELAHRANMGIADVILDTFPYNGATTTLEALWLGIPLVTKVGQQFSARNSYGFITNAGVAEGKAWNDDGYIDWGIKFGLDSRLRKSIYNKLRESRQSSPLWDSKGFTLEMEKAYQAMWSELVKAKVNRV